MIQYIELLKAIKEKGTLKPAARAGMPGTISLFGYQFRHNLKDGFPALTTKALYWKGVVVELLWFLKGDTNIKFLDKHGVRKMWHQDAYNYYVKRVEEFNEEMKRQAKDEAYQMKIGTFERFCEVLADNSKGGDDMSCSWGGDGLKHYIIGDCGHQYGKLWRAWDAYHIEVEQGMTRPIHLWRPHFIDQIKDLINGLKNNPQGRRHLLTAWDPAHLNDMALNACHVLSQFNCRPLDLRRRKDICEGIGGRIDWSDIEDPIAYLDERRVPQYHLDCHMYQRSADVFLGVPLNIASYALLTHLLCVICNMIPGEMIYSYGDVHIYEDHMAAVDEQLARTPTKLPKLNINSEFWHQDPETGDMTADQFLSGLQSEYFTKCFIEEDVQLLGYNPQPKIEAKLSTGLKLMSQSLPKCNAYRVIKDFEYNTYSKMMGMEVRVQVTAGDRFDRLEDEPQSFTNMFTILPESVMIEQTEYFKPIYK